MYLHKVCQASEWIPQQHVEYNGKTWCNCIQKKWFGFKSTLCISRTVTVFKTRVIYTGLSLHLQHAKKNCIYWTFSVQTDNVWWETLISINCNQCSTYIYKCSQLVTRCICMHFYIICNFLDVCLSSHATAFYKIPPLAH